MNEQMTDKMYALAQGPLHLAREKREEKNSIADKSGKLKTSVA